MEAVQVATDIAGGWSWELWNYGNTVTLVAESDTY